MAQKAMQWGGDWGSREAHRPDREADGEDFETPNYALDLVAKLSAAQDQIRELQAENRSLRESLQDRRDRETNPDTRDYLLAMTGEGPQANNWADKPHRLVYDLINKVTAITRQRDDARDLAVRSGIFESEGLAQPEPDDDVIAVNDYTAPDNEQDGYVWGRTHRSGEYGPHSEWKGYKNGGKVYLDWPELVRRWGPLTVAARSGGES